MARIEAVASRREDAVKRMADALRSGAKMLPEVCPVCSSPLFEIKGEMRCITCDKPVVLVKDERESGKALLPFVLTRLDEVVVSKIDEMTERLSRALEIEEISSLSRLLSELLELLKKSTEAQQQRNSSQE